MLKFKWLCGKIQFWGTIDLNFDVYSIVDVDGYSAVNVNML
jgi:hypothetical protein